MAQPGTHRFACPPSRAACLTVRTAEVTRNVEHLSRLLAEHLAKVELKAPVGDLELIAD